MSNAICISINKYIVIDTDLTFIIDVFILVTPVFKMILVYTTSITMDIVFHVQYTIVILNARVIEMYKIKLSLVEIPYRGAIVTASCPALTGYDDIVEVDGYDNLASFIDDYAHYLVHSGRFTFDDFGDLVDETGKFVAITAVPEV